MNPIRSVLCPVDFSGDTERAVALAVSVARRFEARLVLEHNLEPRPPSYLTISWMWSEEFEEAQEERPEDAERKLRRLMGELAERVPCEARLTRGPIDLSLLRVAQELPADLIVMASHGRSGPEHRSLTEKIVAKASCPVLAPGTDPERDALPAAGDEGPACRVLVPVELGSEDVAALNYLAGLDSRLPVRLELVHVEPETTEEARRRNGDEVLERMKLLAPEALVDRTGLHVAFGEPVDSVLRLADEVSADLVLVPAHAKAWFRRKRQSEDFELLHRSPCPIWFVPTAK